MEKQPMEEDERIEAVDGLAAVRERRRREFEEYMRRDPIPPEMEGGEIYRDGKRRFWSSTLYALMGVCEGQEEFGNFTEKVLTEHEESVQYQFYVLDEALKKVEEPELIEEIWNIAYGILDLCGGFYIALGAYIGQNYCFTDLDVKEEINHVGKLMIEERVFPIIAKRVASEGEASESAEVIPAGIKKGGKVTQEKRKPVPEKGILTIEEAAARLGVSRSWMYKKIMAGIIPKIQIGGLCRIPEKEFDAWIAGHKTGGRLKV